MAPELLQLRDAAPPPPTPQATSGARVMGGAGEDIDVNGAAPIGDAASVTPVAPTGAAYGAFDTRASDMWCVPHAHLELR